MPSFRSVLVPIALAGLVNAQDAHNHAEHSDGQLSPALVWVAAMTTQLIMTVIAALGILLVPLLASRPNLNRHVMTGLIAMAAGTLLGDAIIHLIPHSMVPHELLHMDDMFLQLDNPSSVSATEPPLPGCTLHGNHWHCEGGQVFFIGAVLGQGPEAMLDQLRGNTVSHQSLMVTTLLVVLGVYLFYMVELVLHSRGHKHDHAPAHDKDSSKTIAAHTTHHNGINMDESEFRVKDVKPVAWLIIAGDSLHNFFDGLAVGVSFATSWSLGLSTAVAVLMHELPHELGDYAVMLESGIPKFRAALYNMASNLTSFVGAAIGIAVYNLMSDLGQRYVLAITAGGFIYIALADLVPLLFTLTFPNYSSKSGHDFVAPGPTDSDVPISPAAVHDSSSIVSKSSTSKPTRAPYTLILAQNLGFFVGVGVMVIVALFFDDD